MHCQPGLRVDVAYVSGSDSAQQDDQPEYNDQGNSLLPGVNWLSLKTLLWNKILFWDRLFVDQSRCRFDSGLSHHLADRGGDGLGQSFRYQV